MPNISTATINDETSAACCGNRNDARPTVDGKKPEQANPAKLYAAVPKKDVLTAGSNKKAPAINTGKLSQTPVAAGNRDTSHEVSNRPTASAAQNADSAAPAYFGLICLSS
jgi:hypothetical protein